MLLFALTSCWADLGAELVGMGDLSAHRLLQTLATMGKTNEATGAVVLRLRSPTVNAEERHACPSQI